MSTPTPLAPPRAVPPCPRALSRVPAGALVGALVALLAGCSTIKYNALEKIGIYKRDLLVGNVEDTRDAQEEAQEQFKDALERFASIVDIKETGLKKAYDRLNDEYEDSVEAADEVAEQIDEVEEVADDLFDEWREEIADQTNPEYKRDSERQLRETRARYREMLASMKESEQSMRPVLRTLRNNVLYLKSNLNAQAIGSLRATFDELESDIDLLVERMNRSIERSNAFIAGIKPA